MPVKVMEYSHGCIVRLHVANFMHYTDNVVAPAPGFNVVIGHNGSGKSALISAICLGLGGNIETLARNESVTTFVKRGAKEAKITIELHNARGGDNWVVGSAITSKGKITWTLGGERATKTQVEDLVNSLNIQTGNMCQFLPQDVVKSFPLMSPQDRFLSTVRAVGEGKLVDQFDRLKEIQQTISSNHSLILTKEGTLENLKNKMESVIQKKDHLDDVEKKISHKILAEKKLLWARFENDIANAKKIKKKFEDCQGEVKKCESEIFAHKEVDKKKDEEEQRLTEQMSAPLARVQETEAMMMQPDVAKKMLELDHVEQMILNEEEEKADRVTRLEAAKAEVDKITRELKHCTTDSVLDIEISKLKEKENEINNKIHNLSASKSELSYKVKSLKQNIKSSQKSLYELNSAATQKLNQLKKTNPDCYGAVIHLRENMQEWRKKGRFQHGIHEPAVLSLSVPNLDYSVYIEKETGGQQLEAFVCEDPREANDLMQELRQYFKKVSVIHGDLSKMSQFVGPSGERYRSRPREEEMQKMKFVGFVGDMFSGPDAVRTHLFMHTNVYNTAVFAEETEFTDKIGELFPNLRKYYVGKILNTIRVSRYSKCISRGEEDCGTFKPQRLKISYDRDEISKIEKQIGDNEKELKTCEKHILKINDTESKNRQELTQLKKDIAENNEAKAQKNKLEISLKHKKDLVEQLSKSNSTESQSNKLEKYKEDKKRITKEMVKLVQSLQESLKTSGLQYLQQDLFRLKQNQLIERFSVNSNELAKKQGELKDLKKTLASEEKKLNVAKDKLRRSKDEAHNCTADESTNVSKKPPPNYAQQFEKIDRNTILELETHIEDLNKDIQAEDTIISQQVKIRKNFAEKKESIEKLEAELDDLRRKKNEAEAESDNISTVGVQKLQDLIVNVNDKFSSYFADLGYAGQVCLSRKDVMDFRSYGVSIKVKFRDGEDWSELARGRQSGGEMSVTTAVYMLALQELTTVPFRCVDEINQGLDERNERRVWDMILAAATLGPGSQYFYLAPKIPYGLAYKPGTVVHLCHSSDAIKRSFSSVSESDNSRWLEAAKKFKCDKQLVL